MTSEVVFQRLNLPHIAFVPGLYDPCRCETCEKAEVTWPLTETIVLQRLVAFAVRGLYSESKRPQELHEIFQRIIRMVTAEVSGKRWRWDMPIKRTVDRRVNEAASANIRENHVMREGKPPIIRVTEGIYAPNPELYEDVHLSLEASR